MLKVEKVFGLLLSVGGQSACACGPQHIQQCRLIDRQRAGSLFHFGVARVCDRRQQRSGLGLRWTVAA